MSQHSARLANPSNLPTHDQHTSTAPTFGIGPSREHFRKSYRCIRPLASGANGEAFLAIAHKYADDIVKAREGFPNEQAYLDAIRSRIVVAKFAKADRGTEPELDNEINFFDNVLGAMKTGLPVPKLCGHRRKKSEQWLTLELLEGGDLYTHVKNNKDSLSLGFMWHVGVELAKALSFVHYGVIDPSTDDSSTEAAKVGRPLVYHGDIHTGNILLTASSKGSYHEYPDIRLADFGSAKQFVDGKGTRAEFQNRQLSDYKSIGIIMEGLALISRYGKICDGSKAAHCKSRCGKCPRADCEECSGIARRSWHFDGLDPDRKLLANEGRRFGNFRGKTAEHTSDEALGFLKDFIVLAREQRDKHYVPLPEETKRRLSQHPVSDEELRALFKM